jgi:GTP-binding protein HflX
MIRIDAQRDLTKKEVLLIDTVSFISRLPHYIIDVFRSTLEESLAADLILLFIDASNKVEEIRIKFAVGSKVFVILSKHDIVMNSKQIEQISDLKISNPIDISSKTGYGIRN